MRRHSIPTRVLIRHDSARPSSAASQLDSGQGGYLWILLGCQLHLARLTRAYFFRRCRKMAGWCRPGAMAENRLHRTCAQGQATRGEAGGVRADCARSQSLSPGALRAIDRTPAFCRLSGRMPGSGVRSIPAACEASARDRTAASGGQNTSIPADRPLVLLSANKPFSPTFANLREFDLDQF